LLRSWAIAAISVTSSVFCSGGATVCMMFSVLLDRAVLGPVGRSFDVRVLQNLNDDPPSG
jgi:hypothetical protein